MMQNFHQIYIRKWLYRFTGIGNFRETHTTIPRLAAGELIDAVRVMEHLRNEGTSGQCLSHSIVFWGKKEPVMPKSGPM